MHVMPMDEFVEWTDRRNIHLAADRRLGLQSAWPRVVRVRPDEHFTRVIFLTYCLLLLTRQGESSFDGAIFWLRRFDIEDSPINRITGKLCQRLGWNADRDGAADLSLAHHFTSGELIPAASLVFPAIGMPWDAYVIPESGTYLIYKHHDESVDIVAGTELVANAVNRDLTDAGWTPTWVDIDSFLISRESGGT